MVNWFYHLFGFSEGNYLQTQKNFQLSIDSKKIILLTSNVNSKSYQVGKFSTPSLQQLRHQVNKLCSINKSNRGSLDYENIVIGDIFNQHNLSPGALFQAASQFNCLEFIHPNMTPESGIYNYQNDHTQGPACALATVPGTIYRNYLIPIKGHRGQNQYYQLNNLASVQDYLKSRFKKSFISVKNGYSESTDDQLKQLNNLLEQDKKLSNEIKKRVQFGIQKHTQVVFKNRWELVPDKRKCLVSQIYCSALAIHYSKVQNKSLWEPLARIILEASYEATILAGIINFFETKNPRVYLTQLGGGVFGNKDSWISEAIFSAIKRTAKYSVPINIINSFYNPESLKNTFKLLSKKILSIKRLTKNTKSKKESKIKRE